MHNIKTYWVDKGIYYQVNWTTGQTIFCVVGAVPVIEKAFNIYY